jgi:glycosyltransferase involved in cell wall biosynthesis
VRVLVDTSYAARGPSGTAVYIERLVAALRERGGIEVIEAAMPRRPAPGRRSGGPLRSATNAARDLDWLHRGLPAVARDSGADVVHHPLPAFSRRIAAPQVATILDLAFEHHPAGYGRVWRALARRRYRAAAVGGGALVCISEATAADAVELLGAPRERIVVAHLGPGQAEGAAPAAAPGRDFLYVGDAEERKNVAGLLAAYAEYRAASADPAGLVLAGAASELAGGPGVRGAGRPGPAELLDLLRGARALVHPALHEGFGLTLLEAMAVGTPVLAVRTEAVAEVCGDAALLVGPEGLAAGLAALDADAELLAGLRAAGPARAREFSWAACAQAHQQAYTLARR